MARKFKGYEWGANMSSDDGKFAPDHCMVQILQDIRDELKEIKDILKTTGIPISFVEKEKE